MDYIYTYIISTNLRQPQHAEVYIRCFQRNDCLAMRYLLEPQVLYSTITISLLLTRILYLSLFFLIEQVVLSVKYIGLRYFTYAELDALSLIKNPPKVQDVLVAMLFSCGNAVAMAWNVNSSAGLSTRCAFLFTTNTVMLLLSPDLAAHILHVRLREYRKCHAMIAIIATIQGTIHAAVELIKNYRPVTPPQVTGLTVRRSVHDGL